MSLKDTIHESLPLKLAITAVILILIVLSGSIVDADFGEVIENAGQAQIFLTQFLKPEWSYFGDLIEPMIATLAMSVAGTVLGVIFAIPAAFLGTEIVTRNKVVTMIFRAFFSLIRTIPNLLLAAIFVAIVGIGEFTGVLTIAVFTFGMVSQLVFAEIETIDLGPIEANESVGATRFQLAVTSVWPQVQTAVWQYVFYAFEVNVRASAVLGYVGAGGIGVTLNTALGFRQYGRVSLIILFILVVIFLVDWLSNYMREEVL